VPPVGREFLEPVTSDVPTLLISGERDPVTPAADAERAARTLKNSLHVVVPDGSHGFQGIDGAAGCINGLIVRFVETGTVKGLDTSCVARTRRPEFVLKRDPDVEVPADQLARLTGTYVDPESGIASGSRPWALGCGPCGWARRSPCCWRRPRPPVSASRVNPEIP
jgi:fermentation-respiration switch protein FrsA (DUF1100 family)